MTPTANQSSPRGWKLPLAALATIAALAGGAQLLGAAPATAMVGDNEPCSTQFWIDQFVCIVFDEDAAGGSGEGSGSGSGSGSGGAPAAGGKPAPAPDSCANPNIYCVQGKLTKPKETSKPKEPVRIGGPGRPRQQGAEARSDRAARPSGGARRTSKQHSRIPDSCENGKVVGCEPYECKVEGQVRLVPTKKDCDAAKTPEPDLAKLRLCEIFKGMADLSSEMVEGFDRGINSELMGSNHPGVLAWLKDHRDLLASIRNWNKRQQMTDFCAKFLPKEDAGN